MPDREPRVLHVLTDRDRRGAQVFAVDLHLHLLERGWGSAVVAVQPGSLPDPLEVRVLAGGRWSPSGLRALRAAARDVDVVVAHGSATLQTTVLALLGARVPLVYRNISDPVFWWGPVARRRRVLPFLRRCTRVVSLWQGGADWLVSELGLPGDQVVVVPNGVDPAPFLAVSPADRSTARARWGLPDDAYVLLHMAALRPEKHAETAIEAVAALPGARLLVVGDGVRRAELEALAARLAPGQVVFAGLVADPAAAFAAADVFVLPSEGEGLPAVLIEAGLSGLPAVASTSGGNADIVVDGVTGVVVPPADAAALVRGVVAVRDGDPGAGERARQHCLERFAIDRVGRQWEDVLRSVLA